MLDVTTWELWADETAGFDDKLWLVRPGTDERDPASRWLFKPVTVKGGHIHGEDWAEKVASHAAQALTVPCAQVELAVRNGRRGSLSRNLRPSTYDMQSGLVLLSSLVEHYRPGSENVKGRPGHSLRNIGRALEGALPPPGTRLPDDFTAFDAFVGYLVLDAWIANRDRHDENWSVLIPIAPADPNEPMRLCGTYDQAGALGYNVRDEERARRLDQPELLQRWVERGTAGRFEYDPGTGPVTLVALAVEGLGMVSDRARAYWTRKLAAITDAQERTLVARVPEMSDPARSFALAVLRANRGRLLRDCH